MLKMKSAEEQEALAAVAAMAAATDAARIPDFVIDRIPLLAPWNMGFGTLEGR